MNEELIKTMKIYGAECYRAELLNKIQGWEKKKEITPQSVRGLLWSVKIEDCVG